MKLIDLHVHSTVSDGTYSPSELALYAKEKGLDTFALTDHDTIAGIDECQAKGQEIGVTVIPGIEFSADYYGKEVHVLGYYIDHHNKPFIERLEALVKERNNRNLLMLQKLAAKGCMLTEADLVDSSNPNAIITRAHFAKALLEKGYINERSQAFSRYIGDGKPCFVPKARFTTKECIDLIHQVGGLAVLAHPMLYGYSKAEVTQMLRALKADGLDGVECLYSTHTQDETAHLMQVCANLKLFPTGGSDFHGKNKPNLDLGCGYGNLAVPFELLAPMQKKLGLL